MEGNKQQTAAAVAGMSERSARKWQCGPLPSETKQERWWSTCHDHFDGVWWVMIWSTKKSPPRIP